MTIVRRIMKRAKRGTRVVYIPGNHDEMFRQFAGMNFGGVEIRKKAIHMTADGRRLLVLHGDEFDTVMLAHRWLAFLGDAAYDLLMRLNVVVNAVRRRLEPALLVALQACQAQGEERGRVHLPLRGDRRARGRSGCKVDGVVCGHIHTAEPRQFGDVTYYNDGDWVEGCTALVEHSRRADGDPPLGRRDRTARDDAPAATAEVAA